MKKISRTKEIMALLTEHREMRLEDLAAQLGVSAMTVRRDLETLEAQGFLTVGRGRAVLMGGTALELSPLLKNARMSREKKRIAAAAAQFVTEGSSIFLDCGTTVSGLADEIAEIKNLTVVTGSLLVINKLSCLPGLRLVCLPGVFHARAMGFYDASTCRFLRELCVDTAFLGAESADPEYGLTVPDADDAECKKTVCARSGKTVVLADSSKLGGRSMYRYAGFGDIGVFVTDTLCPPARQERLRGTKVQLLCV